MKTIYICVPNRYKDFAYLFYEKLSKSGYNVYYAAKDTPQDIDDEKIYESNIALIRKSDIFIAYFVNDGYYGIDFAVEVGKGSEMNKPIIGFIDISSDNLGNLKEKLKTDIMLKHSFITFVENYGELIKFLASTCTSYVDV